MYPLPQELTGGAFTAAEALRKGVPRERLRRKDVVALGAGVYAVQTLADARTPLETLQLKAAALLRERPDAWISHSSAAQIHRLWLPGGPLTDQRLHLSHPLEPGLWTRRRGVCGHRVSLRPQDITTREGLRLSTPARTWLDVARVCSVRELIIMGDLLVRHPYPRFDARTTPHTTIDELRDLLQATPGAAGRRRCLTALTWIRVGSDSVQETLLRLALIRAGLPEPELQVPAQPGFRWSPRADLGYPALKVAIQYEGDTHFTPQQQRADQRRDNVFLTEGWRVLRFNAEDSREGFQRAVTQVRAALAGG
ncbi:endonuclease domain-containing protein [Nesterenkonia sp. LB17]|uniref:endonuclease domain-containing protein n=1 Tax=unclassified Nesterenkonia TaxID=2629769 RepID=UPI001F4CDAE3|nr:MULTISPECIES: endonuclease domain-containing protein [unclassified Nesterenkonia]MCH8560143.1 endonuclease domain-containing protein [Nesterenkonia sp. DZ6]MCH8564033.1 endonuclease domain-containing protein [Nesterenkonia sp. YGD6]MCH8564144.1 endonuclease domain-containing protein [Nesterenkonia sp. LB17]